MSSSLDVLPFHSFTAMLQTELVSTSMAAELLQSVGIELSLFVLSLFFAFVFHGYPFRRADNLGTQQVASKNRSLDKKEDDVSAQPVAPTSALGQKINRMTSCAGCRDAAAAAEAIKIFEKLKATSDHQSIKDLMACGKHRPAAVFNLLVQCAGRIGRPELVEILLDDMTQWGIERSLEFYECTMKMLASKKRYKEAMSVCSRLELDGLVPSPATLSCLISFAVEVGEPDRAISFYQRLAANSMPSIRAYMTILRVHSRRQDWSKSLAVIRDMQSRQAPIDSVVLNIVLATGVAAGELQSTQELLHEFSKSNGADVISFNTLIGGFAQKKDVENALRLLEDMRHAGVRPNAITFNTAMDAAVRSSRVADAWCVLSQMRDAGLAPDKFTCTTLMKGIQMGAKPEQLMIILDLLRNVTADCDSTLCGTLFRNVIEATAQLKDPALTERAVQQMREQHVMLPSQEYQRLLQKLVRKEDTIQCSTAYRQTAYATMRSGR